jgi:hypothetical protein
VQPDDFPTFDDDLRARARAAIKAEKLPMGGDWGGILREPLGHIPTPILCVVCGRYMHPGDMPYQLTAFPSKPEIHYRQCFDAWLDAARDEWAEQQHPPPT